MFRLTEVIVPAAVRDALFASVMLTAPLVRPIAPVAVTAAVPAVTAKVMGVTVPVGVVMAVADPVVSVTVTTPAVLAALVLTPVNWPVYTPSLELALLPPVAPSDRLAKAVTSCAGVTAWLAVKVNPANV